MRQSTAMAPDYCIRWWCEKELRPPEIDLVAFLSSRIGWRYAHGTPQTSDAAVYLGDSRQQLPRLVREVEVARRTKAKLLITSPPYHGVTNYYYDQWLRLWLLGGPARPNANVSNHYGGKFGNQSRYRVLLEQVFRECNRLLADDAVIYVRTDQRESTYRNTKATLQGIFPEKHIIEQSRPLPAQNQTKAYSCGGASKRANCEIDLILEPR